ncbi:MarR family winged helix-turn-helix transcriptional regulator [Thalassovita aquimarina]|uniref:MarR family transcriptional regulator n=1 Tax=Thalassovita aquimarina TaxID=2785917 RepID=A0ABS5HWB6_9RHOB|nr:MarR family transcriptional regulator [Thalassovita aquimarina]MBR9652863.1 MarR family transcriptional regulator [Thalassovita aquimarina]
MDDDTPYRLHHSLGYHLSVASRLQERRLDEDLKRLGLTRITWCILLAVGNEGLTQPSEIADFVGIDRTATSRALRRMEADGLVERASGTEDRRTRRVALKRKGRNLIGQATIRARDNAAQIERALTDAEQAELKRLLGKLRKAGNGPLPTL